MGELKIQELRARAENALGAEFSLRDFHDIIIADGSMPLSLIERRVDAYIASRLRVGDDSVQQLH
jgi:uncharacterized protein (DUF885 family)